MKYGYGWFWMMIDKGRAVLVPPSTAYETPPFDWHHAETCAVDRVSGVGCTCIRTREETKVDNA